MIEIDHLTKRYGERLAVDDISFRVEPGEVIGFLGPNGAGKSTTLRMLTGYLSPNAGSIRIGDVDAIRDPIGARRQIGYMPESVPLYREMRVEEYLRYRAKLKQVPSGKRREQIDKALEYANVTDVRERIIGQLSKGYRSRVGLADALVADPPLLVLDEPTAGLDPNQIRQVRDLIRGMAGEKTVLLSTHILPEVESTCGRVLIINKGRLVGEGEPGTLRHASQGQQVITVEARGGREELEKVLLAVEGVRSVADATRLGGDPPVTRLSLVADAGEVTERIFAAFAAASLTLRELRRQETSLEDVFAALTTADAAASASQAPPPPDGAQADALGGEGADAGEADAPAQDSTTGAAAEEAER